MKSLVIVFTFLLVSCGGAPVDKGEDSTPKPLSSANSLGVSSSIVGTAASSVMSQSSVSISSLMSSATSVSTSSTLLSSNSSRSSLLASSVVMSSSSRSSISSSRSSSLSSSSINATSSSSSRLSSSSSSSRSPSSSSTGFSSSSVASSLSSAFSDIFLAVGPGQRTVVSCDDGNTWVHNHFTDNIPLSGTDTDHIPFGLRGATYDKGTFYLMWGWGSPTYIERSSDGLNWTGVFGVADPSIRNSSTYDPQLNHYGWGLMAGGNKLLFGNGYWFPYSTNQGDSWTLQDTGVDYNKPIFGYGNGTFVLHPEEGGYFYSSDALMWMPSVAPVECSGGRASTILYEKGIFAVAEGQGVRVCSSTDGIIWKSKSIVGGSPGRLIFDGTRFIISSYYSGELFSSPDADVWTPISGAGLSLATFGASTITGTLVAVQGNTFFRSTNGGQSFQQLPDIAYDKTGGPIHQILFGRVNSRAACN